MDSPPPTREPERDDPTYAGQIRVAGGSLAPGRLTLGATAVLLQASGRPPETIAYRDLAAIALDRGVGLLVAGEGEGSARWLLERFGPAIGPLISTLRERRLRQWLADGLVLAAATIPVEMVEYAAPAAGASRERGVGLLALHPWGAVLAPLDERATWRRLRRSEIGAVEDLPDVGGLRLDKTDGSEAFELPRLGAASTRRRADFETLRDGAAADAGRYLAALLPDAPFGHRRLAAGQLVDGQPVGPAVLGEAWPAVEAAVLGQEPFASSYRALVERAGGSSAPRWLAVAPEAPSGEEFRAWFFVALPGNLVALELVSAGAHATYLFRVVPRAGYRGGDPGPEATLRAVRDVSEALVDARFLREPMALPAAQLATPAGLRYRLALAALPSLAAARSRFVARLVHRDPATWSAALDDLVRWHGACRDDAADWPGRSAQEAAIAGVAETDGGDPDPGAEAAPPGLN